MEDVGIVIVIGIAVPQAISKHITYVLEKELSSEERSAKTLNNGQRIFPLTR